MKIKNKPIIALILAVAIFLSLSSGFSTASADTVWWTLTAAETYSQSEPTSDVSNDARTYQIYITSESARNVEVILYWNNYGTLEKAESVIYTPGTTGATFDAHNGGTVQWVGAYDPVGKNKDGCGATGYVQNQ